MHTLPTGSGKPRTALVGKGSRHHPNGGRARTSMRFRNLTRHMTSRAQQPRAQTLAPGTWPGLGLLCRLPAYFRVTVVALTVFVCGVLVSRPAEPAPAWPTSGDAAAAARAVREL